LSYTVARIRIGHLGKIRQTMTFFIKNLPYASTCYTINNLSSNYLPIMLNLENTNIIKKYKRKQ